MSSRLPENKNGYEARTDIGQHFLIDEKVLTTMSQLAPTGKVMIEIGAGLGQLTKKIAPRTEKLIAIEIDPRFKAKLDEIKVEYPQIEVIIENVLKIDFNLFKNPWIIGNIPYHITEPLIDKLARSYISGAALLVGKSFAEEAMAIENDMNKFGKLSMIVNTFFRTTWVETIGKENFNPSPRTASVIIKMEPRTETEFKEDRTKFLIRMMFLTAGKSPMVKNVLRESLVRFSQAAMTKNEARNIISGWGIPEGVLGKSFEQLNNKEYKLLFEAIKKGQK